MSEVPAPGGAAGAPVASPQGAPAPQNTPAPSDWTSGFNDDLKGYVQNKGFKDPSAVLDSYRNLEKLVGVPKERLLKLPEKDDAPEWNEIYERLGKPKDAKDYNIEIPKDMGDEKFGDWARKTFHEAGLPKKQGDKLASEWNKYVSSTMAERETARQERYANEDKALRSEWGMAYDQEINAAGRAAQVFGIDGDTIDKIEKAMGFAGTMKLFNSMAKKIGEDKFVAPDGGSGKFNVMTPEAAKQRIESLKADKTWTAKYLSGDVSTKDEFEKLLKMANPSPG